jgi:hypothetical protein
MPSTFILIYAYTDPGPSVHILTIYISHGFTIQMEARILLRVYIACLIIHRLRLPNAYGVVRYRLTSKSGQALDTAAMSYRL